MAEGNITIMVGSESGAGIPHELTREREQRLAAQQALADARRQQIEVARLAARNGAQTVEQQRQAPMDRIKNSFVEGDWQKAAQAQAELAVAKSQWSEYAAQIEQTGNTEAAQRFCSSVIM
jgi:hypothetical protein